MPVEFVRDDTVLELGSEVEGRIVVHGYHNTVRIGRGVTLTANLWIQGSHALIDIADGCNIGGVMHIVRGEGGAIRIGAGTTITAAALTLHEAGEIDIGEDCMFSTDIQMDVSDMHPIYDRTTGLRINPARPIRIEDHVWLGARVMVMKGAHIGQGAIVGAGSVVAGALPAHSLSVGSPAKVVREDVTWRRDFDEVVAPAAAAPTARRGLAGLLPGRRS